MAVFRIIPAGDLKLDARGTYEILEGADWTQQKLGCRFKFFLGEWFCDTREGVPYFRDILKKDPSIDIVKSIYRRVILTTPGIVALSRYNVFWDQQLREFSYEFEALHTSGETINVASTDAPFIVRP